MSEPTEPQEMAPLSARAFAAAMEACLADRPRAVAVACSGGPDSLALALLLRDWARDRDIPCRAYTVDHGLRPDSAAEAEAVSRQLRALGLTADILRSEAEGAAPARDIQAVARRLRYRLLLARCRRDGIDSLALGHHLEDQAETFLLRLARGSGVDGLSAMAPAREWGGVRLVRPLLDVPKAALEARLRAEGLDWVEDPSNRDPRFARVRMREAAPTLAALGLTPARLVKTARQMGRARAALETAADALAARSVVRSPAGFARLDPAPLRDAPEEIALRLLAAQVAEIGGQPYPPRLDRLEAACEALVAGRLGGGRSLGGVLLRPAADGRVLICREPAAIRERAPLAPEMIWDGRFLIDFVAPGDGYEVRALGEAGWRTLRRADRDASRRGAALPGPVRRGLPAIWQGERLALAPHLQAEGGLIAEAPRPCRMVFAGPRSAGFPAGRAESGAGASD